jgi:hypothetical protein
MSNVSDSECLGLTYNGLSFVTDDHGQVHSVDLHPAFFAYGDKTRTLEYSAQSEVMHWYGCAGACACEREQAFTDRRFKLCCNVNSLNKQLFVLHFDWKRLEVQRLKAIRDIDYKLRQTATRSVAKRLRPDVTALEERKLKLEIKIATTTVELNSIIDQTTIALGTIDAITCIEIGEQGLRENVTHSQNRCMFAMARNESTLFFSERYGSNDCCLIFGLKYN